MEDQHDTIITTMNDANGETSPTTISKPNKQKSAPNQQTRRKRGNCNPNPTKKPPPAWTTPSYPFNTSSSRNWKSPSPSAPRWKVPLYYSRFQGSNNCHNNSPSMIKGILNAEDTSETTNPNPNDQHWYFSFFSTRKNNGFFPFRRFVISTVAILAIICNVRKAFNPFWADDVRSSSKHKPPKEMKEAATSIARAAALFSSMDTSRIRIESSIDKTNETPETKHIGSSSNKTNAHYSFADFVKKHETIYASKNEYNRRRRNFNDNLSTIRRHNSKTVDGGNAFHANWKMGINPYADRMPDEIPLGLDKTALRIGEKRTATTSNPMTDSERASLLSSLPDSVDWRTRGVATPVKNQGRCGSCWAFASTAALESHIAIRTGKLLELSVQELVTCAPNTNHCGGTGGCGGNTAELAYDFVSSGFGMVTEWEWAYISGADGKTPDCSLPNKSNKNNNTNTKNHSAIDGAIASIDGYTNLDRNDYLGLLTAVAMIGPVVVNVATTGWHLYESGIFDDSSSDDRDIDHVVVVEGYGTEVVVDETTGTERFLDYWLVRNSWGPLWGEDGYIRLKRDANAANDDCRPDTTPSDGIACVGPDNTTIPPEVEVCGTAGILYDAVYPTGAHLLREGTPLLDPVHAAAAPRQP